MSGALVIFLGLAWGGVAGALIRERDYVWAGIYVYMSLACLAFGLLMVAEALPR